MRVAWHVAIVASLLLAGCQTPPEAAPAPVAAEPQAPDAPCPDGDPHVWFLAAVEESAQREDYQEFVDFFETILGTLRESRCIPAERANILAFRDDYTRNGTIYEAASETNLLRLLDEYGNATAGAPAVVIVFIAATSYATIPFEYCDRLYSSLVLVADDANDGFVDDCQLGDVLGASFAPDVNIVLGVDCVFCGGFSDSATPLSGLIPDNDVPSSSGVPGPGRIIITGCSMVTPCFSGVDSVAGMMSEAIVDHDEYCDGWTAPGFPTVQGLNVPVRDEAANPADGRCTVSELFFGGLERLRVEHAPQHSATLPSFRMKYGFDTLAEDIELLVAP